MTDKKISELSSASTLDGSEQFPLVQSATTVQMTLANMFGDGHAASSGFKSLYHVALGSNATIDNPYYAPGDPSFGTAFGTSPTTLILSDYFSGDLSSGTQYAGLTAYNGYKHTGVGATGEIYGLDSEPAINSDSTGPIGGFVGGYFSASNFGTGTVTDLQGIKAIGQQFALSGSQTTTRMSAGWFQNWLRYGTIASAYGILVKTPALFGGTPTVTNSYGVYIEDQSGIGATDSLNILSKGGSANNLFEGIVTVGKASTATGKVKFSGTTSGTLTLTVPDAASNNTIKLPSANPTNGYSVTTDGSGNWTYTNVSGAPGGSSTQLQYNNSGAFGGIDGVTTDGHVLTLNDAAQYYTLIKTDVGGAGANGTEALRFGQYNVPTVRYWSICQATAGDGSSYALQFSGTISGTSTDAFWVSQGGTIGTGSFKNLLSGSYGDKFNMQVPAFSGSSSFDGITISDGSANRGQFQVSSSASPTNNLNNIWVGHLGTGDLGLAARGTQSGSKIIFYAPNTSPVLAQVGTWDFNAVSVTGAVGSTLFVRVTSQFDKTSNVTLANVTGLSVSIVNGLNYKFEAVLYTASANTGGVQFAIAGTSTASAIVYEALVIDNKTIADQTRTTTKGNAVGAVTAVTAAHVKISGTIACNGSGTLTVQFAQNASDGTPSSVLVGSTFEVLNIP